MEEHPVSCTRRHGNGLLERISVRTTPQDWHAPTLHVRNRWSRLNPGFPVAFNKIPADVRPERTGV